jgi:hypothetical protein
MLHLQEREVRHLLLDKDVPLVSNEEHKLQIATCCGDHMMGLIEHAIADRHVTELGLKVVPC